MANGTALVVIDTRPGIAEVPAADAYGTWDEGGLSAAQIFFDKEPLA